MVKRKSGNDDREVRTRGPRELLEAVGDSPPIRAKLERIAAGEAVVFEHVTEAARPFLAALICGSANPKSKIENRKSTWLVCENVRAQELFHNELLNWLPDALFLPELEAASELSVPDPELNAERLAVLQKLGAGVQVVVVTRPSLEHAAPSPGGLKKVAVRLARGKRLDRDKLLAQLEKAGYEHVPQVADRGQYAVRGGIIDLFSWQHALPVRVELFGDEIESIRQFDRDAQTSVEPLDACSLLLGEAEGAGRLRDWIGADDLTVDANAGFEAARVTLLEGSEGVEAVEDFAGAFFEHGLGDFEAGDLVVEGGKRAQLHRQLAEWRADGWRVAIFCNNEGEVERLGDLLPEEELENPRLSFPIGVVSAGFIFPAAKVALLSDAELFGRYRNTRARRLAMRRARERSSRSQIDFSELIEGELVVHLEHGIGRYRGIELLPGAEGQESEVLALEFADQARLFVPLEQSFMVSRYVGVGKKSPPLSSLGDARWAKAKKAAERAVFDYAARLLSVHAERETSVGFAFPPDVKWQHEFERSFVYKETADQVTAIAATKADMESEQPMDRLICGDVGFGKTEVAIRAAFKAVMSGKQVALLVPTTVLAEQHYRNFRERMSDYPITVEMLSRFRTPAEQKKIVAGLVDGSVDIVVGTHRLTSGDVKFKDLGLVVIDEEQRFGVLHKEKFKALFNLVDVLTLSATPIPRTLYLSLMGAKDMSVIETPPANRIPTETIICGYDERVIRDAIQRELARQGQVYFLHNRISDIERVRDRILHLVPQARVEIGHGQMNEHELEDVMQRFVDGKSDVLVSTTIIESGLDIPNANTIIIDRADRFGLADLYQLRGRVGRAQHKAHAYLMVPRELMTVGAARKRINAIKQYSSLGAGFKIAMRDLEIRGAGNILGTQQSGHIVSIGFDLYCQLLRQAMSKLKGEKVRPRLEVPLLLDFVATTEAQWASVQDEAIAPAFVPASYIREPEVRIQAYRALAEVSVQEQLDALRKMWRDRFGPLPQAAENLLRMTEIKLAAASRRTTRVEVKDRKIMLTRGGDYVLIGGKFPRLAASDPTARLDELLSVVRAFSG